MTSRHIEVAIPKKTLEDLIARHLYSISYVNDNEDVEIEFKVKHLQTDDQHIPITMNIRSEV